MERQKSEPAEPAAFDEASPQDTFKNTSQSKRLRETQLDTNPSNSKQLSDVPHGYCALLEGPGGKTRCGWRLIDYRWMRIYERYGEGGEVWLHCDLLCVFQPSEIVSTSSGVKSESHETCQLFVDDVSSRVHRVHKKSAYVTF